MKKTEIIQRVNDYMRLHTYSRETISNYVSVVNNFLSYLSSHKEITAQSPKKRIEAYLTWLVVKKDVSPSTQNVHLNALLLLHNKVLEMNIQGVDAMRAKEKYRIPPILSREQVFSFIDACPKEYQTLVKVLYGGGLRIQEALRLRIKDIDFGNEKIVIHEGKGDKDRDVIMPGALIADLKCQIEIATKQWQIDRSRKLEGVYLPHALARKYPKASKSIDWYWLFPNPNLGNDPEVNILRRHHIYPYTIGKMFQQIREKINLPIYTTPHILRHACFTHMAADLYNQGLPEKMIKSYLRDMAGHVTEDTINAYLHLAMPKNAIVRSPLDF